MSIPDSQIAITCISMLILSAVFTCVFMPFARWFARKFDAIDYPSGRRVNKEPIPRTGGIAMFFGMSCALGILFLEVNLGLISTPFVAHPYLNIDWTITAFGVFVMFVVGLVDDLYDLNPFVKLFGQIVSACFVASSGILLVSIGNPASDSAILLGWLSYPLTVLYLVAFANIINLVDGLDGLASGVTSISAITIMVFAVMHGRTDVLILGMALLGACFAFLKFNWNPAKVFMGDSGALVLGLMLGILSLVAIARSTLFTSLLVPILSAGVPILDTLLAIIRRNRAHVPIMSADRGHIHHRLLDSGHSQKQVVVIMLAWTACLSAAGIIITMTTGWVRGAVFAVAIVSSLFAIFKLNVIKPVLVHKYSPRLSKRRVQDGTYTHNDLEQARQSARDDADKKTSDAD